MQFEEFVKTISATDAVFLVLFLYCFWVFLSERKESKKLIQQQHQTIDEQQHFITQQTEVLHEISENVKETSANVDRITHRLEIIEGKLRK